VFCVVELAGNGVAAARPTNDNNARWDIFMMMEDSSVSLTTRRELETEKQRKKSSSHVGIYIAVRKNLSRARQTYSPDSPLWGNHAPHIERD
jgi:hypothetical protein